MADIVGPVAFLNRTYEEAIELLVEARNYLAFEEAKDRAGMRPADRLLLTLETTRLTTMLTHIIAWLLVQRAVSAGEMTRDTAAAPEHRLGGREVCEEDGAVRDERLPLRLRDLLLRGHRLYVRVSRLDELAGRRAPAAVPSG